MATVNKDFKIKSGLVVEGTTGTINGYDILKKSEADDQYIINLIGGETLVKSVEATQLEVSVAGKLSVKANVFDAYGAAADAEAAAAIDATSKADAAEADAISAAATDATNKANAVASDLTDHENATVAHGATGAVVGTTNTQTLTNKTIGDTLNFTGAGAMTINSDSHIVLTPAAGSSVKWGADVLATQGYADQAEADAISAAATDATNKANAAEADANTYTDGKISTEVTDRNSAITSAIGTEVTDRNSAIATAKGQAIADANAYTDAEVAALVDSAPELLDTLNELAAAIADNPNYASDVANAVAGRVAKSGDTMTGDLTLPGAPTLDLHASTKKYVDDQAYLADMSARGYADGAAAAVASDLTDHEALSAGVHGVTGSVVGTTDTQDLSNKRIIDALQFTDGVTIANEAEIVVIAGSHDFEVNAKSGDLALKSLVSDIILTPASGYDVKWGADVLATQAYVDNQTTSDVAEGTNLYFTNQRAIDAVGGTIGDQINLLDTDDIEEGETNLYFTDLRAKTSAIDLLTGADKTNIAITWSAPTGLVITAENGVADSTTSDLTEGSNLYFTDVRAVDALEAVVPNFTAVEINSLAKEVAATATVSVPSTATALTWDTAEYRTVKALVKFATANHTEVSEVLLTLDGLDNIAITEYAMVGTNGSMGTITATVVAGEGRLNVTTLNNATVVFVKATLLV